MKRVPSIFETTSSRQPRLRRIILSAIIGGVGLQLLIFVVLPVLPDLVGGPAFRVPALHYRGAQGTSADPVLLEQAALADSAPLFLPTVWNSAADLSAIRRPAPSALFPPFPDQITLSTSRPPPAAESEATGDPFQPGLLLAIERWPFMKGFGETNVPVEPLSPRSACLRFRQTGADSFSRIVSLAATEEGNPGDGWTPARYYLLVDATGPIGEPLVGRSSGDEAADAWLGRKLRDPTLVAGLPVGYYEVLAEP